MNKNYQYNGSLCTSYKNAEIEIVIEDDVITTGRVFIDGECVKCDDLVTSTGKDIPFNSKNYQEVLEMAKADVDEMWNECLALATAGR